MPDLRVHSIKALISVVGMALLVLVVTLVSQTITRPLVALSAASDRLGQGDLDVALLPVESRTRSVTCPAFRTMQARKDFIVRLETETASQTGSKAS
jgi:methyl-accepting chemotaxis protein